MRFQLRPSNCFKFLTAARALQEKMETNFQVFETEELELIELMKHCRDAESLLEVATMLIESVLICMSYERGLQIMQFTARHTHDSRAHELLQQWIMLHATEHEFHEETDN